MDLPLRCDHKNRPQLTAVCVFCGSRDGTNPSFLKASKTLGRQCANSGIRVVYGGAGIGMMGAVARSALDAGGKVTGIVPKFLTEMEPQLDGLDDFILTETMHDRKIKMYEISDAFVIMPGGIGTLDETMEILTWRQLGVHAKPVIIANLDNYWDPFLEMIDHVIEQGYAGENVRGLYRTVTSVEDILPTITNELSNIPVDKKRSSVRA